jgi:Tol biopolymer transport system component
MQGRRSVSMLVRRRTPRAPFAIASIFLAGLLGAPACAGGSDTRSSVRPAGGTPSANGSNGAILFVRGSSGLYLVNADGSGLRLFARDVWGAGWSPDGTSIAYLRDALEVVKSGAAVPVRVSGTDVNSLASLESFSWSPDSTHLAYANPRGAIYVVGSDGSAKRRLVPRQGSDPSWSPDGLRIAFTHFIGARAHADDQSGSSVFVMEADGSRPHVLIEHAFNPIWSPDGRKISFKRQTSQLLREHLYVANADGSNARKLTSDPADLTDGIHPALASQWSPDGSEIAFSGSFSPVGLDSPVLKTFLVNADGGGLRLLERDAAGVSWSPDGTTLAIVHDKELEADLWTVAPHGTASRRVTQGAGSPYRFFSQWHPRGAHTGDIGLSELENRRDVSLDFPGLTIRVPVGWDIYASYWQPALHSYSSSLSSGTADTDSSIVFVKPPRVVLDPRRHRGVRLRTTFLEWIVTHPHLKTTAIKNIRLAGFPAQMVDGRVRSADSPAYYKGFCGETMSQSPCVPLTADKGPEGFVTLSLYPRETFRVITARLPRGRKLLILIHDRRTFAKTAMKVLGTLQLK